MNIGMSSTGVAIVLIVYRVLKWLNKKKFVSECCGKKMEVGVSVVENSTPRVEPISDGKPVVGKVENV